MKLSAETVTMLRPDCLRQFPRLLTVNITYIPTRMSTIVMSSSLPITQILRSKAKNSEPYQESFLNGSFFLVMTARLLLFQRAKKR